MAEPDYKSRPVRAIHRNELGNEVKVTVCDRHDAAHVYIRYSNNITSIVPLDTVTVIEEGPKPKGRRKA